MRSALVMYIVAGILSAFAAGPMYRPGQEYRTTTSAAYEVSIQKNGRIDVNLTGGDAVFLNAQPMIWFEGEEEARPLSIDGRHTARQEVSDRLGKGQGMVMKHKECEWSHRTYPTKPFFTVQVAYTNTTKKPVRVKSLFPWCAGDPRPGKGDGGFSLGPGTAGSTTLESGHMFPGDIDLPGLRQGAGTSLWNAAVLNPETGRSLIAGFLANNKAYTRITYSNPVAAGDGPHRFSWFAAECVYDPAVEVAPGAQLVSEPLYLSVAESDPLEGLERFGQAMAAANNVRRPKPFLPHGWDSWSTEYRTDINEEKVLENLAFVAAQLKPYGWNHFALDDGWQTNRGDWDVNLQRFPNGLRAITDRIHAQGMTAGIWIAPFTVHTASNVARAHPEWLAEPNALGKQTLGDDERILDVTIPEAYAYIRDVIVRIRRDWGFDALVEADYVYHLTLAEQYARKDLTRVEVMKRGMQALREGMGDDGFIMTMPPLPINGVVAQGMRVGTDCAPVWRQVPGKWPLGCVEALSNTMHKYYFTPWMWAPDQDCAFFAHDATRERWGVTDQPKLTWDQSTAWLTGAAMTGGVVKIGERFSALNEREVWAMRKMLPSLERSARPIDLFTNEHPQVWVLPVRSKIGDWVLLGLFNWDETAAQTLSVRMPDLGLSANTFYTVYGFWEEKYYGSAENELSVSVPPASMRLLSLRPLENRPMFLSTDRHISQGATDFTALEWDAATRTLRGKFDGIAGAEYTLRVLVPAPYTVQSLSVSCGDTVTRMDERVLVFTFTCGRTEPVEWKVQF